MHYITKSVEFPKNLKKIFNQALRYEWISLFYMISASIFSGIVISNSQTMKTIWIEDTLGIIPPLSFLITSKIITWRANRNFPYGFHKSTGIAYLSSSLALFILGFYLLIDGLHVLIKADHPTIPTITVLNHSVWLGNLMLIALLWSSIPSTILGYIKIPLAEQLNDKILYADSRMNKASWMSGFASIFGIIGIGFGFWWADAAIGILISINIIFDGFKNVKQSILDLIDEIPKLPGKNITDPLIKEVHDLIGKEKWIKSIKSRFRDDGHVFFGEIYLEIESENIKIEAIHKLKEKIQNYHWRLHDITIMPIKY